MKKGIVFFSILTMFFGSMSLASADQINTENEYIQIWEDINDEYNLNMPLHYVHENKISIEEFKSKAREIIEAERELLDYLAQIEETSYHSENIVQPYAAVTKTRTKPTFSFPNHILIQATYTVNNNRISSVSSSSLKYTNTALFSNTYLTNISSPTYSYIDASRAVSVKYTAKIHFDSIFGTTTTLYTEFYYDA